MSIVIDLDHNGYAIDQNLYLDVSMTSMMYEHIFLHYMISGEIEDMLGINEYLILMPGDGFVRSSVLIGEFLIE